MTSSELLEKHTCEIVEDLLPYYAQHKHVSPAFAFVEEHLKCCANCKRMLEMVQEDFKEPTPAPDMKAIHFRQKYHIRLAFGVVGATLAATAVLVLLF